MTTELIRQPPPRFSYLGVQVTTNISDWYENSPANPLFVLPAKAGIQGRGAARMSGPLLLQQGTAAPITVGLDRPRFSYLGVQVTTDMSDWYENSPANPLFVLPAKAGIQGRGAARMSGPLLLQQGTAAPITVGLDRPRFSYLGVQVTTGMSDCSKTTSNALYSFHNMEVTLERTPHMTAARQRIHASMVDLLAQAGLDYSGGYVNVGGIRVHYLDYGEGEPVLLIHGGGAGGAIWYRQIAALKDSYRVLAPDNPVFGLSSQPSVPTPPRQFAREYVQGFIEALQLDSVRIAGLSLGGFISLAQAVDRSPRIRSMALIDSAGLGTHLPWVFRLMALPVFGHAVAMPRKFMHDLFFDIKLVANSRGRESESFKRYAFETTRLEGHSLAIRRHAPGFANLKGQKVVFSDDELRAIDIPTAIIWGQQDRFFPVAHAERAHRTIRGAELHRIDNAGHVSLWDRPHVVNDILGEFFSKT